jgi:hypothetical protein
MGWEGPWKLWPSLEGLFYDTMKLALGSTTPRWLEIYDTSRDGSQCMVGMQGGCLLGCNQLLQGEHAVVGMVNMQGCRQLVKLNRLET